ncbi:MAG: dihydroneopterin aldolase [Rubrivivax sp.]|nr:dihydroneopterin aldolase [Rubrivivax sp.]
MQGRFEILRLQRQMQIGCADDEQGVRQAVELTIRVTLDERHLFAGDTFTPPYDYCRSVQAVDDALASREHFILQETLLVAVAARILADPVIEDVELEITKTERYAGCDGIGIRARLTRADLAVLAPRYPEDAALAAFAPTPTPA